MTRVTSSEVPMVDDSVVLVDSEKDHVAFFHVPFDGNAILPVPTDFGYARHTWQR